MSTEPTHHIARHILKVLTFSESARYRDMRPSGVDSNLFNYHRKVLMQQGFIKQNEDKSYSLDKNGYKLAEKATFSDLRIRERPKLTVLYIMTNKDGMLAVWDKAVQPFIGTSNLPNGKMRFDDVTIESAAERMLDEIAPKAKARLALAGVAEVCVIQGGEVLTHTINMVAKVELMEQAINNPIIRWISRRSLVDINATPGVAAICKDFWPAKQYLYKSYIINL